MDNQKLEQRLDELKKLHRTAESFTEWQALSDLKPEFEQKLERFNQEQQLLSIGIMGQVKAGKSTFLNTLLFEGQSILPEAATPKTANLTRITYGEQPRLVVEYYTTEEWQEIERQAATGAESGQGKVAKELVAMVQGNGLNASEILAGGSEQEVKADSTDDLLDKLNQYVGDNGQYTALVKMTHLYLPREELKGYEVVDTPGMNDPVQSRTQKTRDYMSQCDVVFFLSRASQFLDQSDMNLLAEQLPSKGIKRMHLVAGQFDSSILDDGYDRRSLAETKENLKARLSRGASEKIKQLVEQRRKAGNENVANLLQGMQEPIFASTFAHGFAVRSEDRWNETMQHVHNELIELAENEWSGYQFTQDDWLKMGNFATLENCYETARAERIKILEEQKQSIYPEAEKQLQERLASLQEAVANRHAQLQQGDLKALKQQQQICEQRIEGMQSALGMHISETLTRARDGAEQLVHQLQADIASHSRLSTRTGSRTEQRSYKVSVSKWYNPFSWGEKETRYESYSVDYEYLSASDAAEQVRDYSCQAAMDIENCFNNLVHPDRLKADLRKTLIHELDTSSEGFDPQQFRSILSHTLDRLEIPVLKLNNRDMTQAISSQFSGEVTSSEMDDLKRALTDALHEVFTSMADAFSDASRKLFKQLENLRDTLGQQLTEDMREELAKVEADFAQQSERLASYEQLLFDIRAIENRSQSKATVETA